MDKIEYVETLWKAYRAIEGDMNKANSYVSTASRQELHIAVNSLYRVLIEATDGVSPIVWIDQEKRAQANK